MDENQFEPSVLVSPYHLGVMLTNSVQYALKRNTGMPLLVQRMFEAYLPHIPLQALEMAMSDIDYAGRTGEIPDATDWEWPRTKTIIEQEIARRRPLG